GLRFQQVWKKKLVADHSALGGPTRHHRSRNSCSGPTRAQEVRRGCDAGLIYFADSAWIVCCLRKTSRASRSRKASVPPSFEVEYAPARLAYARQSSSRDPFKYW